MASGMRIAAGALPLALIVALVGGALAGLLMQGASSAGSTALFDSYLFQVTRFTLWQAALSTLLSVLPALLVARALARHPNFPGRRFILQMFAVPLGLPAIVAAIGILSLYGRAGYLAPVAKALWDWQWPGAYGLSGILIAHVFFNLPMAARLFLAALETVPPHQWRLSAQLGMGSLASFRFVEWPVLRTALPGVAGLVFMLCVTSFTIVLTLGGGPGATTLEVAIYQALRFDFDPQRAVALTAVQLVLTAAALWLLTRLGVSLTGDANLPLSSRRVLFPTGPERGFNAIVIALAVLFVGSPMMTVVAAGLGADLARLAGEDAVHRATATSLGLAFAAASLSVTLSFGLVIARRALELRRGAGKPGLTERLFDNGAMMVLVIPPIVIGAGWFVLLRNFVDVFQIAPIMVVSVNAVMALPFAMRIIRPAYDAASQRHERLCASLGIGGFARLKLIDWPPMRRPALLAFAFAMALSLGDLGVIALFGSDQVQTLPYLLLQRMGSYRTADAAGLALFIGILCLGLMAIAGREKAGANVARE